jgi:hypothetical protein
MQPLRGALCAVLHGGGQKRGGVQPCHALTASLIAEKRSLA